MEPRYKISIPKPCHENWNEMTPNEKGRFCNVCSKSVVDFTSMKEHEVQDFFIENQNKKVCGRFRNEQIESTFKFNVPQTILFQKRSFSKAFLLSLFVVMGTSLFSCKNHQNQTLGEVAVVNDSIITAEENTLTGDTTITMKPEVEEFGTLGIVLPVKDSVKQKCIKPSKPKKAAQKISKESEKEIIMGDIAPEIVKDSMSNK